MFKNETRKEIVGVFPWRTKAQIFDCVWVFFVVIISLKAFAKYPFLRAFILKLLCLVLMIPEASCVLFHV